MRQSSALGPGCLPACVLAPARRGSPCWRGSPDRWPVLQALGLWACANLETRLIVGSQPAGTAAALAESRVCPLSTYVLPRSNSAKQALRQSWKEGTWGVLLRTEGRCPCALAPWLMFPETSESLRPWGHQVLTLPHPGALHLPLVLTSHSLSAASGPLVPLPLPPLPSLPLCLGPGPSSHGHGGGLRAITFAPGQRQGVSWAIGGA